ncbi:MAG: M20/M25/M40 family metallo-hydrolase [Gemmatimonadales bacterium]
MMRRLTALAALAIGGSAVAAAAQGLTGFALSAAARELQLEARLQAIPDTGSAEAWTRVLAAKPHVAGTPAQRETADFVMRQMASWGLDTQRVAFRVYLPYDDSAVVERVTPTRVRLVLDEPPVPGDPTTILKPWPAMNGSSGKGDVTAPLVYVNQGLPADFARLDSLGVSVRGRIAIARYGGSFRGIKAREAEAHGAVALLLYSDPRDDGFVVGPTYPDGPMRNPDEVQRGSIFNGEGDPTTPGWASTVDARRLPEDSLDVPHIPVMPIGYRNAELLMKPMAGPPVPGSWQGGMRFPYHLGDSTVQVRVAVWPERGARAFKTIYDTFGWLRGSDFPDEWVIAGAHRDAWGPGADDNVSGTVSVMEAARAMAQAAREGFRPRRTVVFATWDAEEWGLVGSVEWVQLMRDTLQARAVAYLNQDESASGRNFGASADASLRGLIRDAAATVTMPGDTISILQRWLQPAGARGVQRAVTGGVLAREPRMGDLGGGSDFTGFYNNLGIPSMETGFGGRSGWYHSAYDTYTAMERFGDPGYLSHAAEGRLVGVILSRLANADVIPYDYSALGTYLASLASPSGVAPRIREPNLNRLATPLGEVVAAADTLRAAGSRFDSARDAILRRGGVAAAALARTNEALQRVGPKLTRPAGLPGRPFMRNLVFASDRDNGYADVALPGISEALRDGDLQRAQREAHDLAERIRAAAAQVDAARTALDGQ